MTTRFKAKLAGLKYVHLNNTHYVRYRPRIPKSKQHIHKVDKNGFLSPGFNLGKITQSREAIMRKYLAAKDYLDKKSEPNANTLKWISDKYQTSRQFSELTPKVQNEYRAKARILEHMVIRAGEPVQLGELLASEISKPVIHTIVERRLADMKSRGYKGESVINYETRYLSSMLSWACNYIPNVGISTNPLQGLKKLVEPKNERYVTDREYRIQMGYATGYLPAYFELAYQLAGRKCEVREIRESDLKAEGILVRRRKGSKSNIVAWTPRLRQAVEMAKASRPKKKVSTLHDDPTILADRNGQKISNEGVKSAMSRLKKKMTEAGDADVFWTMHHLKHKGQTDTEDKRLSGHKHEQMKARYEHSFETVDPAG